ncbi:hypothetical protein FA13DRAFT_1807751 [Coprinellus micaceus]|uniref:Uncharacterized protein n=1 Tax=Coprinellus micaceus TaxID=71717 RepID=A0A4Y7R5J2_COPMI|nr:hypothetical protein FA13DRAFT_1807751 [Coprinellus micaceus]
MAKEKEWTLFLGDKEEEDSFVRVRKASQSATEKVKERGSLEERRSEREADVLRQRTKSAGPRLLTSPEATMGEMKRRLKAELKAEVDGVTLPPFATESPVGKPLLRVKSMVDLDDETDARQPRTKPSSTPGGEHRECDCVHGEGEGACPPS